MTDLRYAERAARLLRAARARIRPHRTIAPENAITEIASAIERVVSRRRRQRITAAVGLAAAISGGVVLVAIWGPRRASLVPPARPATAARASLVASADARATLADADGRVLALPPGHAWRPDERLQTEALPITLAAEDGTTVELEPRSDLQLLRADAEQWLRLGSGAVAVHVAKLQSGQRFVIVTPDAQVEVRGTRFHVALASPDATCGHGTPTRVVVDEGVVVVRLATGEVRVPAGQRWPADCAVTQAPSAPALKPRPSMTRRPPRGVPAPPSTLATENDLFGAALRAEHAGDRAKAARLLESLLTRFPSSPLTESAQRAHARVTATARPAP
ncbi:MAG TPA: FecR domain-containing protein [Polyangia bacterium]|nr:FecR domain-containing protein [Polyangia bacterium]